MFDLLPNAWTPVLPISEIETQPVAIELAGERIVLFRNSSNEIGALVVAVRTVAQHFRWGE
jgi:phenylpropionate dioxygenase-like ring-hydroxylating dioxygenase large terminal subunit